MRHSLRFLVVVAAASVGSCIADASAATPPFVGIVSDPYGGATRVGCFDPLTLRARSSPLFVGEYHDAWSTSPDGTRLALGISAPGSGSRVGVRIVDLARPATRLDVETGIAAEAVAWLTDRTLVAALIRGGIVLIDPETGDVIRRWAGWTSLDAVSARTRRRFVLLARGGRTRRLATVDRKGRLRSLSLRLPVSRRARPALIADPAREHAYVLSGSRVVLDVDLRRMRVRRPRLHPALEEGIGGGLWLGSGRLAVTGPSLSTVDTQTWQVEVVDSAATGAALTRGRLLAFGARGVRGYSRAGRRVFEVLRKTSVWSLGATGRLAYAGTPRATYVIDIRSGEVRRRISRPRELSGVIARRCP